MSALPSTIHPQRARDAEMQHFLCERYWLPATDFPNCPDIFHALGISGSDCHDFMELYSNLFAVDLSDFIWPKFHLSESESQDVRRVLRPVMRLAGLKTQPLNRDLIAISIDHLLQVAAHGLWFDPADVAPSERAAGMGRSLTRFSARLRAGGVPKTPRR